MTLRARWKRWRRRLGRWWWLSGELAVAERRARLWKRAADDVVRDALYDVRAAERNTAFEHKRRVEAEAKQRKAEAVVKALRQRLAALSNEVYPRTAYRRDLGDYTPLP